MPYLLSAKKTTEIISRGFLWSHNDGGDIRQSIILSPCNDKSLESLTTKLNAEFKLSNEKDGDGNEISASHLLREPLSEMFEEENWTGFLAKFLNDRYTNFENSVLVIRADLMKLVSPEQAYVFHLAIVENTPNRALIEYCQSHRNRLLFVFTPEDYVLHFELINSIIRPFNPSIEVFDDEQIEDLTAHEEDLTRNTAAIVLTHLQKLGVRRA